jgi:hypothetical protein
MYQAELPDVEPSEISFKEKLSSAKASEIFLVVIRGKTCVMKVVGEKILRF